MGATTTFDPSTNTYIFPASINSADVIAGYYSDGDEGFVRGAHLTTFLVPGTDGGTFPMSVNDAGAIAGWYTSRNNVYHGFLLTP
jgi:hypothetical protein